MFQSLDLVVLGCLFLTVESQTGEISRPQNLSLVWINDFEASFAWAPPLHSASDCLYEILFETKREVRDTIKRETWTSGFMVMEGGSLSFSVQTVCNGKKSEPAVHKVTYPGMVNNLNCYIHSSKLTRCSWDFNSPAPALRFYYRLVCDDVSCPSNDTLPNLQECSSYQFTQGVRAGCDLQADYRDRIHILFNGTVNNTFYRNTFWQLLRNDVRPPPLQWNVTKAGNKFNISWIPSDIDEEFEYLTIDYTECDAPKVRTTREKTSFQLNLNSACSYCMTITAKHNTFSTPPSDEKCFDADTDANVLVYAAIIIPLMFAVLAALTLVCCRKNKEYIFPKVPQPRDLLSDISDNNNKATVCNLYIPKEEEEHCKISLVIDPQISKPDR